MAGLPRRLQHVERAQGIRLEVGARVDDGRRHRGLTRKMVDRLLARCGAQDRRVIPDVALDEVERACAEGGAQPFQVRRAASPRQIVKYRHPVTRLNAGRGKIAADEAGAAGDQNAHPASVH